MLEMGIKRSDKQAVFSKLRERLVSGDTDPTVVTFEKDSGIIA